MENVRLDKWLWAARFYKTRSLSRQMVQSGKVQVDGQRAKPAKTIVTGQLIKLSQGSSVMEVEVLELSDQRRGAPEAQKLYQETPESIERREREAELRKMNAMNNPHPDHKPDKKERRQLLKMKR
ncbi:ribosome-associated heat shock protein Hsp15 [Pseudidiomarina terrestris]|uniref:Heat shock protein 15 n=1 Tax=Pseudidiomarina terrestris TaxID=2820060 RepID=A0AAW7R0W4_9GAMM|nr:MULTISPECIES: ribosome-associated heat shock protein Hsp15 [unclassified Pseudidiomarina]MDN7124441.1 ribosome-associated heat shock protein Hsp15 [Pseudidiomarina sp. 1APP75-32.1]MDN7127004.1 ribosome-associated heat shock protein Hsp15 [Pseudidiomarina sp. 1APR75-33.1]MDN7129268.1 ribosome-associated heat shock protein Hsp15 [Pseudidiomarina sp. 1APR75-15]MDN7134466.1 ribosome-associated heat shock protein Hsp15 [Pseudidiomarina sp. 1ASP75-5]MEA3587739.1 ribosome-associated heat shock pro